MSLWGNFSNCISEGSVIMSFCEPQSGCCERLSYQPIGSDVLCLHSCLAGSSLIVLLWTNTGLLTSDLPHLLIEPAKPKQQPLLTLLSCRLFPDNPLSPISLCDDSDRMKCWRTKGCHRQLVIYSFFVGINYKSIWRTINCEINKVIRRGSGWI